MFYDRKIKYLDYLENGDKVRNAGFVKIEVSGDVCNIQVCVNGLHKTDSYVREVSVCGGSSETVLGEIVLQEGRGSAMWKKENAAALGREGIPYEDLREIRIKLAKNRELRCRWSERAQGSKKGGGSMEKPSGPEVNLGGNPAGSLREGQPAGSEVSPGGKPAGNPAGSLREGQSVGSEVSPGGKPGGKPTGSLREGQPAGSEVSPGGNSAVNPAGNLWEGQSAGSEVSPGGNSGGKPAGNLREGQSAGSEVSPGGNSAVNPAGNLWEGQSAGSEVSPGGNSGGKPAGNLWEGQSAESEVSPGGNSAGNSVVNLREGQPAGPEVSLGGNSAGNLREGQPVGPEVSLGENPVGSLREGLSEEPAVNRGEAPPFSTPEVMWVYRPEGLASPPEEAHKDWREGNSEAFTEDPLTEETFTEETFTEETFTEKTLTEETLTVKTGTCQQERMAELSSEGFVSPRRKEGAGVERLSRTEKQSRGDACPPKTNDENEKWIRLDWEHGGGQERLPGEVSSGRPEAGYGNPETDAAVRQGNSNTPPEQKSGADGGRTRQNRPPEVMAQENPVLPSRLYDDKWKQLCFLYPHISPFHDGRDYLSIGPADFVVLQKKYHKLVNNSFLLHGFYNYEHLILTRVERKGEERFYVGVPGNFYDREKQVAVMFGFESFECQKEPADTGDYGYYMIRVEI